MAEWSCSGLQLRLRRFDSDSSLHIIRLAVTPQPKVVHQCTKKLPNKSLPESRAPHVRGIKLDAETRCSHYHSELDVVAIQFFCCKEWYACVYCHAELSDHPITVWPRTEQNARAILCGKCHQTMSIHAYIHGGDKCANCGTSFNPGCRLHHHLYFEVTQ